MKKDNKNSREISKERKTTYYIGMALSVIGILMFLSVFVISFTNPFSAFRAFPLAFFGIILIWIGQGLMTVGKKGLAGSGLKLDPEEARKDLEPFTRTGGAMIADAYDEFKNETTSNSEPIIKIKCRSCGTLNDEDANFCDSCGTKL